MPKAALIDVLRAAPGDLDTWAESFTPSELQLIQ
jgi:hypothetical protein